MKANSLFLLVFALLFAACKKEAEAPKPIEPEEPLPLVSILMPLQDSTVFVGDKVTVRGRIVGTITDFGFLVNDQKANNLGNSTSPYTEVTSDRAQTLTVKLYAENKRGKTEKAVRIKFVERPVPLTKLLHNDDKKTWLLTSVKFNETDELIKPFEKDDKITFFANPQRDGSVTFNYTYDVGRLVENDMQTSVNGNWKLTADRVLEIKPTFSDPVYIDKIDENNLVFYRRLSPTSRVYFYFKKS